MPPKFKRLVNPTDYTSARDQEREGLLDGQSDEDDFFLSGPNTRPDRLIGDDRVGRVQEQVDDVVVVMRDNIAKVVDRGDRLEDLQDKSDDLSAHADQFRSQSKVLRSRMWWKECRMRILLAIVILVVLIIIIVPIIIKKRK